jgi:hypothetical protein
LDGLAQDQVKLQQFPAKPPATYLKPACDGNFLVAGQQRISADLLQILPDRFIASETTRAHVGPLARHIQGFPIARRWGKIMKTFGRQILGRS